MLFFKKKNLIPQCERSFSQTGEDIIVKFIFSNLVGIPKPTYIDIGSYDPFELSNTAIFYELGCKGVNIDPNPFAIEKFRKCRPTDTNLNLGVGAINTESDYYMFEAGSLNTFSEDELKNRKQSLIETRKVQVRTLSSIIENNCNGIFPDFLSLDVEGLNLDVLSSYDFSSTFPKVICCETIVEVSENNWQKDIDLINFIKDKGYLIHSDTGINTIFLHETITKHKLRFVTEYRNV